MSRPLLALSAAAALLLAFGAGVIGRDRFRSEPALADAGTAASASPLDAAPSPTAPSAPPAPTVPIGARIDSLSFVDARYLPRTLSELGPRQAFVLAFTSVTCPVSQRYQPVLAELEREYRGRGVQFLSVNVGADDTMAEAAAQAAEAGLEFPLVKDFTGEVIEALGVRRTPEVALLDAERVLRYRGRIDDGIRFAGVQPQTEQPFLRRAIDALLARAPVDVPETPVEGCAITLHRVAPDPALTWSEHVAPLVRQHCAGCHQPGGSAPFALLTWSDVAKRAAMIEEVVEQQRMPPWFASPERGAISGALFLAPAERDTLLAWLRAGAARGEAGPEAAPPSAPRPAAWRIRDDLVLESERDVPIPAAGPFPYQVVEVPHVFEHDTWIDGIDIQTRNPRALHHGFLGARKPGSDDEGTENDMYLHMYVPGGSPLDLQPGVALRIPRGSRLRFDLHYTPTGREESDRVSVALRFPRAIVRKQLHGTDLRERGFEIPAGHPAYAVSARRDLPFSVSLVAAFPHMHARGRDMCLYATRLDGTRETLLVVGNYSFDWQRLYRWEQGTKRFPPGTSFEAVGRFDNSSFNPFNPDPTAAVRFSRMTDGEMMLCTLFYTVDGQIMSLRVDPETGATLGGNR